MIDSLKDKLNNLKSKIKDNLDKLKSNIKDNLDKLKPKIKNSLDKLAPKIADVLNALETKIRKKWKSITAVAIVFLIVFSTALIFTKNFTIAISVSYENHDIGVVQAKSTVETATEIIKEKVVTKTAEQKQNIEIKPETSVVITKRDNVISEQELVNNIIDNSSEIVKGEALLVDGSLYAAVDGKCDIDETLDSILEEHKTGAENEEVEFVEDVKVIKGIFLSDDIVDEATLENNIKEKKPMQISKSYQETKIEEVPFEVELVESDKYIQGTEIVQQDGENGIVEYVEKVTQVNDEETNRTVLEKDFVKDPIKKRIIVGTGKPSIDPSNNIKVNLDGIQFVLPLSDSYISSHYGGRGGSFHKGVDLCVAGGTLGRPVLSTAQGVVKEVLPTNKSGGYGLKIVIDHGNNIKSLYAHLDSVNVQPGQIVQVGEQIGTAGNTGNSTGPHLHFELLINNNRVNPMDYVG